MSHETRALAHARKAKLGNPGKTADGDWARYERIQQSNVRVASIG